MDLNTFRRFNALADLGDSMTDEEAQEMENLQAEMAEEDTRLDALLAEEDAWLASSTSDDEF